MFLGNAAFNEGRARTPAVTAAAGDWPAPARGARPGRRRNRRKPAGSGLGHCVAHTSVSATVSVRLSLPSTSHPQPKARGFWTTTAAPAREGGWTPTPRPDPLSQRFSTRALDSAPRHSAPGRPGRLRVGPGPARPDPWPATAPRPAQDAHTRKRKEVGADLAPDGALVAARPWPRAAFSPGTTPLASRPTFIPPSRRQSTLCTVSRVSGRPPCLPGLPGPGRPRPGCARRPRRPPRAPRPAAPAGPRGQVGAVVAGAAAEGAQQWRPGPGPSGPAPPRPACACASYRRRSTTSSERGVRG